MSNEAPTPGEIWALKSDASRTLKVDYVNSNGFVGYSCAAHMKRGYGTLKISVFLYRYKKKETTS